MVKHRFFCERLTAGQVRLDPGESRHAAQVLRLPVGTLIDLFDGRGGAATGRITDASKTSLVAAVEEIWHVPCPPGPALAFFTALPRMARQHILFEKCTELGVARIVPTRFARSTVRPKARSVAKWRRITIEAGKQAGCLHLPEVAAPADFGRTLEEPFPAGARLVATVSDKRASLSDVVKEALEAPAVAVWIGPEGGLTEEELTVLFAAGCRPVSLGPHVLRVETAAIAVAAAFAMNG